MKKIVVYPKYKKKNQTIIHTKKSNEKQ